MSSVKAVISTSIEAGRPQNGEKLLESRMMGNYHVRFGGGLMEKCLRVTRQQPTLLLNKAYEFLTSNSQVEAEADDAATIADE